MYYPDPRFMPRLDPRHMTDSELDRVINSFVWARGVGLPTDVITEYDEKAMEEQCKRIKSIESRENK
jgi:hypothetical protein